MAGTRSQISCLQILQVFKMENGLIGSILRWFHKVFPFVFKFIFVWIVVEIDTSDGVLHHVLHNPVRCEDLSGRCNLV